MSHDQTVGHSLIIISASMMILLVIGAILLLTSCTYSITQVHTEGTAEDVVDETSTPTATTSLPISLTK